MEGLSGYDHERFLDFQGDAFDCAICLMIVKNPRECSHCGNLFCQSCISDWKKRQDQCPNRCPAGTPIKELSKATQRIYNQLQIKCKNFQQCNTVCKMENLQAHEYECGLPKCPNFDICANRLKQNIFNDCCSISCALLAKLRKVDLNNLKVVREATEEFLKENPISSNKLALKIPGVLGVGVTTFCWDDKKIGTGIELSEKNKKAFLREQAYMFKTVIADQPMMNGIHYWEIHADPRTENELKIGVSVTAQMNFNSAFCDFAFGYAYYGLGQLRHGSNANGVPYGKRFKKEGYIGCYLDMNKGQLSFSLNGENMGVAFTSDALKKGPIYAAVSLLHTAGFTLVNEKPAPELFLR